MAKPLDSSVKLQICSLFRSGEILIYSLVGGPKKTKTWGNAHTIDKFGQCKYLKRQTEN
jgi:hypothetical protein